MTGPAGAATEARSSLTQPNTAWLRSNPVEMMGNRRPQSFEALLKSSDPLWRRVYLEWLTDPNNRARAGLDSSTTNALSLFNDLTNPAKSEWTAADKGLIKVFGEKYEETFYADLGAVKEHIRAQIEAKTRSGVDAKAAREQVTGQLAREAIASKVKEAAATTSAPVVLSAWAQVQAFKQQQLSVIAEAVAAFQDPHWGADEDGGQRKKAEAILAAADAPRHTAEGVLRNVVLDIQGRINQKKPILPLHEEALFQALVDWASAQTRMANALVECSQLVVDWARRNAAKMIDENFDAAFPIVGGILLGAKTAVGVTGIVVTFFPELAPVSAGLDGAMAVIDTGVHELTSIFASRQKKYMVKFAGKEFSTPDDYYETTMGKAYKAKQDAKKKVDEAVTAAKDAVVHAADWILAELYKKYPQAKQHADEITAAVTDLEKTLKKAADEAGDKGDEALKAVAGKYAGDIEDALRRTADYCGEKVVDNVLDVLKGVLWDLFAKLAPNLAGMIAKAMPGINIAIFITQTADDVLEYHHSIHMKLVAKEGYTDADVKALEMLVARQLQNNKQTVLQALKLDDVKYDGLSGDGGYKFVVGGVRGSFHPETVRFSPDDRTEMKQAVLTAVKRNNQAGTYQLDADTFEVDWATFDLDVDGEAGTYRAAVKAMPVPGTGRPDYHEYLLELTVGADGYSIAHHKHQLDIKLPASPPNSGLDEKLYYNAYAKTPAPIMADELARFLNKQVVVDGKKFKVVSIEGGIRPAAGASSVSFDALAEYELEDTVTQLSLLYVIGQDLHVEKVGRMENRANAKAEKQIHAQEIADQLKDLVPAGRAAADPEKEKKQGTAFGHLLAGLKKKKK